MLQRSVFRSPGPAIRALEAYVLRGEPAAVPVLVATHVQWHVRSIFYDLVTQQLTKATLVSRQQN